MAGIKPFPQAFSFDAQAVTAFLEPILPPAVPVDAAAASAVIILFAEPAGIPLAVPVAVFAAGTVVTPAVAPPFAPAAVVFVWPAVVWSGVPVVVVAPVVVQPVVPAGVTVVLPAVVVVPAVAVIFPPLVVLAAVVAVHVVVPPVTPVIPFSSLSAFARCRLFVKTGAVVPTAVVVVVSLPVSVVIAPCRPSCLTGKVPAACGAICRIHRCATMCAF